MLTSEIWNGCGYRRPRGQVRVRLMPAAPVDALFGHPNHVDIHELFDFDLSAAKSGRIKRIEVIKQGFINAGIYVVPTAATERKRAARRNLEALREELIKEYYDQFRVLLSRRTGRTAPGQRKDDRRTANKKLSEPLSIAAIRRQWPDETAIFEALRPLQSAIDAVTEEIAFL